MTKKFNPNVFCSVGGVAATHPDSYDVDLHGHQKSVQHHQQGRDAEPQVLRADLVLCKLPQLNGLGDEGQHPVDEQDCADTETWHSVVH